MPITREKACSGKKSYKTRGAARATLRQLIDRGERHLNIYRCPFCPKWHIGHFPGVAAFVRETKAQ